MLLGAPPVTQAGFVAAGLRLPRCPPRAGRATGLEAARSPRSWGWRSGWGCSSATLSYGDRKRVELARALCVDPGLLLIDEPVAGMSARRDDRHGPAISEVRADLGIAVLLVEHDMAVGDAHRRPR